MTVVDGDVVYKVRWDHRAAPQVTTCVIQLGNVGFTREQWDNESITVSADAHLNPKDAYCRNKGRRVSLSHVLALTRNDEVRAFSLALRAKIWRAYREQLGHW